MKSRYYVDAIAIWVLLMLALSLSWGDNSVTGFLISRGDAIPAGYGAPYDVFPPGSQLIDASFDNGQIRVSTSAEWTYKKGYYYKDGWQERNSFTFSGAGATGNWIAGAASAQAAATLPPGKNYALAFTCRKVDRQYWKDCTNDNQCGNDKCIGNKCDNPWRCGCRTQDDCGYWQIQTFDAAPPEPPAICGNGIREGGEQCDDGNTNNNDACIIDTAKNYQCKNAVCGDGYLRTGTEQCDDGNTRSGDGCSATCTTESTANAPTLSSLSPTSGTAGTTVDATGTGFISANTVRFGASDVSSTRISDTRLQFNVPQAAANSYDVSVKNANGESSKMSFTLQAASTFGVTCAGSPNPSAVYNPVAFTASVSGGTAPYTYTWSGERILSNERVMNVTYSSDQCSSYPCTKTANIEVKDSSSPQKTATGSCTVTLKEKCQTDADCAATRFCDNSGFCFPKAGVCEYPQSDRCGADGVCQVTCGVPVSTNSVGGCQRDPDCSQDKYCTIWCPAAQDDQQFCNLCGVQGTTLASCSKPTICGNTGGVSVTCAALPASPTTGTEVTFTATPSGASSYAYSWSGGTATEAIAGTERQVKKTFTTAGTKTANIRVTDSANSARSGSGSCSAAVQEGIVSSACGNWGQQCCPITSNNNRQCRSLVAWCKDGTCQARQFSCSRQCAAGTYCGPLDSCVQCLQDSQCGSGKVCSNYFACVTDPRTITDCYTSTPMGCGATGWFCHYADHKCYPLVCIPPGTGEANPCPTGWACKQNECQPKF